MCSPVSSLTSRVPYLMRGAERESSHAVWRGGSRRLMRSTRPPACWPKGKRYPAGAAKLVWIHGCAKTAPLNPPYAMIVAGARLHWMAWDAVLPRFRDALTPRGLLAIVDNREAPPR